MADQTLISPPETRTPSSHRVDGFKDGAQPTGWLRRLSPSVVFRRRRARVPSPIEPVILTPSGSGGGTGLSGRNRWFWFSYFGFVLLPTIVVFSYYAFIATPQYDCEVKFVVRGGTQTMPGAGIMGPAALIQFMKMNNNQEGAIIASYIQSGGMLEYLAGQVDLTHIYGRPEIDWLSRLRRIHPIEEAVDYWLKMASVQIETMGGVLTLRIRAFSPEEALKLTTLALKRSEDMVNDMLRQAREDAIASAETEMRYSLVQTATARDALEEFRDTEKHIDSDDSARSLLGAESKLRQQKIEIETELTTLQLRLSEDSPVIREARGRIQKIDNQIQDLRGQLIKAQPSEKSISSAIRLYEHRKFELQAAESNQDLADRLLAQARRESEMRHVYLEIYDPPASTTKAVYPAPLWQASRFGGQLFFLWLIVSLFIIRVSEHTD